MKRVDVFVTHKKKIKKQIRDGYVGIYKRYKEGKQKSIQVKYEKSMYRIKFESIGGKSSIECKVTKYVMRSNIANVKTINEEIEKKSIDKATKKLLFFVVSNFLLSEISDDMKSIISTNFEHFGVDQNDVLYISHKFCFGNIGDDIEIYIRCLKNKALTVHIDGERLTHEHRGENVVVRLMRDRKKPFETKVLEISSDSKSFTHTIYLIAIDMSVCIESIMDVNLSCSIHKQSNDSLFYCKPIWRVEHGGVLDAFSFMMESNYNTDILSWFPTVCSATSSFHLFFHHRQLFPERMKSMTHAFVIKMYLDLFKTLAGCFGCKNPLISDFVRWAANQYFVN